MCPRCAAEYADPLDRRFHAQPDACWECGPHISWSVTGEANQEITWGNTREASDAIFAAAVRMLLDGGIVAVKGLGGFHLVCDATNPEALAKLRQRKRRWGKAFAVMVASADEARRVCHIDQAEQGVLESTKRPIVLLRKRQEAHFAAGLADKLPELGVMLPCTPVQHLLLHDFTRALQAQRGTDALAMLVMTSGNLHEPIVTDDAQARQKLAGIADAVLGNNRAILSRYDDSVVRVIQAGGEQAIQFVRRARGYAPLPLPLGCPEAQPKQETLLAVGPEQKATFALVRAAAADDQQPDAFVSQHIGDVENAETYDAWLGAKSRYESLFQKRPTRFACDKHPEYLTSKWAREQAQRNKLPLVECSTTMRTSPRCWARTTCSALCAASRSTARATAPTATSGAARCCWQTSKPTSASRTSPTFPCPAARRPSVTRCAWRMACCMSSTCLNTRVRQTCWRGAGGQADVCAQMIERGLNTPYTSSVRPPVRRYQRHPGHLPAAHVRRPARHRA